MTEIPDNFYETVVEGLAFLRAGQESVRVELSGINKRLDKVNGSIDTLYGEVNNNRDRIGSLRNELALHPTACIMREKVEAIEIKLKGIDSVNTTTREWFKELIVPLLKYAGIILLVLIGSHYEQVLDAFR